MTLDEIKREFSDYETPIITDAQGKEITDPAYRGQRIPVTLIYNGALKCAKRGNHPDAKITYTCEMDTITGARSRDEVGYEANGNPSLYMDAAHYWKWLSKYKYILAMHDRSGNYGLRLLNAGTTRKVKTFTVEEADGHTFTVNEDQLNILEDYLTPSDYAALQRKESGVPIMWVNIDRIETVLVG